jgi:hypothetical protein
MPSFLVWLLAASIEHAAYHAIWPRSPVPVC